MTTPPSQPLLEDSLLDRSRSARTRLLLEAAERLGFAHVGVCSAEPVDRREQLSNWLDDGKHGEMNYLSDRVEAMLDPGSVLEGARSIICVADRYASASEDPPPPGPPAGQTPDPGQPGGHAVPEV